MRRLRLAAMLLPLLLVGTAAASPAARLLDGVGFDQRIGARVPLDAAFRDQAGRAVRLGDQFRGRPVALLLAWYDCPNLCGTLIGEFAARLRETDLVAGRDYRVIVASFDPHDSPAAARRMQTRYGIDAPFLTGPPGSIDALTRSVGFRAARDRDTDAWIHPGGVVLLAPDGRVSRYVFALDPGAGTLRYGLVEASAGRIGGPADRLWLLCHTYDPQTGRYTSLVENLGRGVGLASLLALAGVTGWCARRRRR